LPLAEPAAQSQRTDRRRQVQVPTPVTIGRHHLRRRSYRNNFRLILV